MGLWTRWIVACAQLLLEAPRLCFVLPLPLIFNICEGRKCSEVAMSIVKSQNIYKIFFSFPVIFFFKAFLHYPYLLWDFCDFFVRNFCLSFYIWTVSMNLSIWSDIYIFQSLFPNLQYPSYKIYVSRKKLREHRPFDKVNCFYGNYVWYLISKQAGKKAFLPPTKHLLYVSETIQHVLEQ